MNIEEVQRMKQRFRIIGNAPELNRAIDVAMQVAPTDLTVLITGESGSGKDVIPKIIHDNSARKSRKYLAVNCGAIPEGTIDSELFGHVKGSFTNAINDRKGYFGEADGGTIFLDEVAELPLATQARLLRVLETGEFIRVGSSNVEKTDVRIVAATNVNLQKAIEQGRFREDLFYRLSTIPVKVPSLRERGNDILLLFRKFAADCAEKYHMPAIQLSDDARQMMLAYGWPGNVRQLKNITEQISIMAQQRLITAEMLQGYLPESPGPMLPMLAGAGQPENQFRDEREILYKVLFDLRRDVTDLKAQVDTLSRNTSQIQPQPVSIITPHDTIAPVQSVRNANDRADDDIQDTEVYVEETLSLDEVEKDMIRRALAKHGGKRRNAAADLNISERTLYRKIREYNLE
ncbi:MAG: sigma-54-dependent Fis family transcriptional regulator [Bacteroidaceae bacterium]|nr:sigma-54-dependent Fis family transcriptional regulator [Bacteroidaceae bacterium]MBO7589828.1 sigma-54-dependent Fis family transcriptional regulator [Bacteroidaceae bacterium]